MSTETPKQREPLFNSPLEAGVRSVVILNYVAPCAYDLTHLTWFDHLVVHTRDLNGPESLHPDVPQRNGELLVRRRLVEDGLRLMKKVHLIETVGSVDGIAYRATEEASPFVELIRTPYGATLKERAQWLAKYLGTEAGGGVEKLIREKIGRWKIEFSTENQSGVG